MVNDFSGWRWLDMDALEPLRPPAWSRLKEFTMPILLIVGERDYADYHGIGQSLAAEANARYVVVPGVGHMSNMEAPETVNRLLIEFLDTSDGRSS